MSTQAYQQLEEAVSSLQRLFQTLENGDSELDIPADFLYHLGFITKSSNEILEQSHSNLTKMVLQENSFDSLDKFKDFIQTSNDEIYNAMRKLLYRLDPWPLNLNHSEIIPETVFLEPQGVESTIPEKNEVVIERSEKKEKKVEKSNFLEVVSKDMPNITISFETFENMFRKLKIHECSCIIQRVDGEMVTPIQDATYEYIIDKHEMSFNDSDDVEVIFQSGVVELSDFEYIDIHSYVLNRMLMD